MTAASSITPAPTEEEAAAIVVALDAAWARPVDAEVERRRSGAWRFSGRWWTQPLPLRRARPWV